MRFFARQSENPDSDKYQTPQSLHRFEVGEEYIVTERFDPEQGWVDNPEMLGFMGIGGDEDYIEIDEETALHIIGQLAEEKDAKESLWEMGETFLELAGGQIPIDESMEMGDRIHIDQEAGGWLRDKGGEGGDTYLGGAKEPSDGVFAIPEGLVSAQRRKGFVKDQIAPAAEETELEDEEVAEAVGQVRRTFDNFMSGLKKMFGKRRQDG